VHCDPPLATAPILYSHVASWVIFNVCDEKICVMVILYRKQFSFCFQCMMHLEDRLQEIYFKSKMMAEYLKKNKNVPDLLAMFG